MPNKTILILDSRPNLRNLMLFDGAEVVDREPPKGFLVVKYGKTQYTKGETKGEYEFTEADADKVLADFQERGKDIVVDYEHQTLSGNEAPAAGWISGLRKTADGLWADVKYWTENALNRFREGEYRYFSPVLHTSRRHPFCLHSVALTNHPATHGIPSLVASDDEPEQPEKQTEVLTDMNPLQAIAEKLGVVVIALADGAMDVKSTLTACLSKMEEIMQQIYSMKQFLTLHDAKSLDEVTAKIGQMVPATEKAELQKRVARIEAEKAVDLVLSEGKITAAQREPAIVYALNDLAAFQAFYAAAPVIVPGKSPVDGDEKPNTEPKVIALTDAEKKTYEQMGLTDAQIEEIKKQKKEG